MIKKNYGIPAALIAVAGLLGTPAYGADGTINFTGSLTDATCLVKVNNTSANGTVGLPAVSKLSLASTGVVAGATVFTLNLSGCTTGKTVNAYFEAGPTVDAVTGNLVNGGTAGNVQVQLLTGAGVPIAVGDCRIAWPGAFPARARTAPTYR